MMIKPSLSHVVYSQAKNKKNTDKYFMNVNTNIIWVDKKLYNLNWIRQRLKADITIFDSEYELDSLASKISGVENKKKITSTDIKCNLWIDLPSKKFQIFL